MEFRAKVKKNLTPDELYRVLGYLYLELNNVYKNLEKITKDVKYLQEKLEKKVE